jgi:hypothetical protein
MKLYSSFLLRCWVIRDESEKIVFDIEQIQTGEHRRTATPEEALQWILTACQNSQPEVLEAEPEEPDLQASQTGQPGQSL